MNPNKCSNLVRYYANAVLDHLHRSKAIAEWTKVLNGASVNLERALGAFDLFVLHDQHGDLLEVRFHGDKGHLVQLISYLDFGNF